MPVVVLIDGGSASASEIVAAALQEHGRAQLVGEATFGKNTVQIWNDLPNGGGLRLTTDRWFTPEHNSVAPDGVQPDVEVAAPEDPTSDEDPQLDRALESARGADRRCALALFGQRLLSRSERRSIPVRRQLVHDRMH